MLIFAAIFKFVFARHLEAKYNRAKSAHVTLTEERKSYEK